MSVKLSEIANKTGVSISTVSRVLNNDMKKPASAKTREKIMEAARALGYFSSGSQAASVQPAQHRIVCYLASDTYTDNFFSRLLMGIQAEADRRGYLIANSFSTANSSIDAVLNLVGDPSTEGLILMGRVRRSLMTELKARTSNIVYAGLNRTNAGIDEVVCDAYSAIRRSVRFLRDSGHTKIGFLGAIDDQKGEILNEHRFRAYSDEMTALGLPLEKKYCKDIPLSTASAYEAMCEMLEAGNVPEALCCANDNVAIGAISALNRYKLRVPEDVSVIGLDNIDTGMYFKPSLTTHEVHAKELGGLALRLLSDRINGLHFTPLYVEMQSEIIVRDSCRK